jgi:2OG-Fe(II) oxygenase superfamily
MLRVMSAGMYQPTPHRVINTSGDKTRTSVAFFYEPVRLRLWLFFWKDCTINSSHTARPVVCGGRVAGLNYGLHHPDPV